MVHGTTQDWRPLMELTRRVARELALEGRIEILQRGRLVDPNGPPRGPIRLRAIVNDKN